MSQNEFDDVRKTLLKLYTDHALQYTGFGIGVLVALAQELAGYAVISKLTFSHVSLFLPIFFSTLMLAAQTFFKSAFWGRMNLTAVKTAYGALDPKTIEAHKLIEYKGAPILGVMYDFHSEEVKKRIKKGSRIRLGGFVYRIMVLDYPSAIGWIAVAFVIGIFVTIIV